MVKKRTIRKLLIFSAWLLVIGGLCTLLVAANHKQREHRCQEVRIGIQGSGDKFYIEKEDVFGLMTAAAHGSLIGRPISSVDLARLENALEGNAWIHTAELYIDNKDVLHVLVTEREPIARVFTTTGTSFYIDSSGHRMPLLEKLSARVPVVTGYSDIRLMNAADSALLQEVKNVAAYIYGDSFWSAQVGQIDITPERRFELIPVVGDHIIRIGDGEKVEEKLRRLYVFYQQVLSKVGFNKYAAVDVQFDGQVVAVKKGPASAVDSIQLQKNIEELMNKASLQQAADEEEAAAALTDSGAARAATARIDTVSTRTAIPRHDTTQTAGPMTHDTALHGSQLRVRKKPAARTTAPVARPPVKPAASPPKRTSPKPRAVMPRQT